MKKLFFLIFFLLFNVISYSQIAYPQTLTFKKKIVSVTYIDNNGLEQYQSGTPIIGEYKFDFGKATTVKASPILDIYGDVNQKGYFAFVERYNNKQIGSKIYEHNLFFSTEIEKGLYIYLAFDKSSIILVYDDKIIEYIK